MNHYLTKAISPYRTNIYLSYDQYSYSIEMFIYYNCNLMEQFDWINYCLIRVRMFYCILIIHGNLWGMAQLRVSWLCLLSGQYLMCGGAARCGSTCFPNHRSRKVICVFNLSQNNIGRCRCIFLRIKNCRHIDIVISTITSFSGFSSWKSNVLTLYEIIILPVL